MTGEKSLISNYFKHLFVERYDCEGHDLSVAAYKKLEKILPEEKKDFFKKFNTETNQIIDILSEEDREGTEQDEKIITEYEKLADTPELPVFVRAKMYDLVLTGREKYIEGTVGYLNTLYKKISILDSSYVSDLKEASLLLNLHSAYTNYNLKHKLSQLIKQKSTIIPTASAQEQKREKNKAYNTAKKKHRIDAARQKIADIDERLKSPLSAEERTDLLLQKIDALGKNGEGRMKTYRAKVKIYQELQTIAYQQKKYEEAYNFGSNARHQEKLIDNILNHLILKDQNRNY